MGELDNWTSPKPCVEIVNGLLKRSENSPAIHITLYPDSYHAFDTPQLPLTERHGLAYVVGPNHTATIGTNEKARKLAVEKALKILRERL